MSESSAQGRHLKAANAIAYNGLVQNLDDDVDEGQRDVGGGGTTEVVGQGAIFHHNALVMHSIVAHGVKVSQV